MALKVSVLNSSGPSRQVAWAGRQAWSELESSSDFTPWTTEKAKWEWCELLEPQSPPSNGTPPPTKSHLLILPKQLYQSEKAFKYEPMSMRVILIQITKVCNKDQLWRCQCLWGWVRQVWNKQVYITVWVSMWESECIMTQGKTAGGMQSWKAFLERQLKWFGPSWPP